MLELLLPRVEICAPVEDVCERILGPAEDRPREVVMTWHHLEGVCLLIPRDTGHAYRSIVLDMSIARQPVTNPFVEVSSMLEQITTSVRGRQEPSHLSQRANWAVWRAEVGEIRLNPLRENVCEATLYAENNPKRWSVGDKAMIEPGKNLLLALWQDVIIYIGTEIAAEYESRGEIPVD